MFLLPNKISIPASVSWNYVVCLQLAECLEGNIFNSFCVMFAILVVLVIWKLADVNVRDF